MTSIFGENSLNITNSINPIIKIASMSLIILNYLKKLLI